jgi:hypothetical protein
MANAALELDSNTIRHLILTTDLGKGQISDIAGNVAAAVDLRHVSR